jgi:hypothetical protein
MWASLSTTVHAKVDVVEARREVRSNKAARLAWFASRVLAVHATAIFSRNHFEASIRVQTSIVIVIVGSL